MHRETLAAARTRCWSPSVSCLAAGMFVTCSMLMFAVAKADSGATVITTVEEDWELVVGEPDADTLCATSDRCDFARRESRSLIRCARFQPP